MAVQLEESIKAAAAKVAKYIEDVATLTVETRYVEIGGAGAVDFDADSKAAARTIIKLDSDSKVVVPVRPAAGGGLEIDSALNDLHERNVKAAIEYRERMLKTLIGVIQSAGQ